MDKLVIAVGHSRMSKTWKNTEITWMDFIERLRTTCRTPETQGEYTNMTKSQQDAIKDVGGFVGGKVINGRRKAGSIEKRYILTLDADYATEDFCDSLNMFFGISWCVYSTHKHTPEKPRLRLLIPLSRPCTPDEYEAIARKVAFIIGIDMFDDTTYQAHRLMYWPSTSIDGKYVFRYEDLQPLNVDKILDTYTNWKDVTSWPTSSRTLNTKDKRIKKQEDPAEKQGLVGAFCRSYDISTAIATFIPGVYEKCDLQDRYTYTSGTTAAGAVVYDDGKFMFSNHATDPTSGMLCNAFDLIRMHKFADEDETAADNTPTAKLPSYLKMQKLAASDKKVKMTLHNEQMESAKEDFAGLKSIGPGAVEDEGYNEEWVLELEVDNKGKKVSTINNAKLILANDLALRKKIRYNDFTKKYIIFGTVPWDKNENERDWTDTDDAGLRHYFEKAHNLKGRFVIEDALTLTVKENSYHPVRDYLNNLKWDGEKRIETLFIDYLGADDNEYVRLVTKKSLVAAIARILVPGVKYDTMLVLVGPQGCGKSQIIKRLGRDWFSDTLTTMQGKEAYEQIQGFWIIEVAELSAMKRKEIESTKHFTAKSEDAYRAAYGHRVEVYKRQCVFFGTTNKYEFLKDMTGNRRFWPVDVNPDLATKNIWRDLDDDAVNQIWAESVELFRQGEKIYIDGNRIRALAAEEQDRHLEDNPLSGDINMYLEKLLPDDWDNYDLSSRRIFIQGNEFGKEAKGKVVRVKVCPLEVWCELFNGDKKDLTIQKSKEIKELILKNYGWEQMKSAVRFGDLYGSQRGLVRKI